MNGKLYILIGIPGSGKTTFCKNWIEKNGGGIHVSRDEIRYAILDETDSYFAKEKEVFQKFIFEIEKKLMLNKNVYADATHLSQNSRKKLFEALTLVPDKIIGLYFDVPFEVALERNRKRTGRAYVPEAQMESMNEHFEKPSLKEGFDVIYTIDINGNIVNKEVKE